MKLFAEELISFPDPQGPIEEGIVDMSDDLRVERLLEAYSFGIFPWPHEDLPTLWFSPSERGVIEFSEFHVPRSLAKLIKKPDYSFTFDRCFERVIEECANLRRAEQPGTWITPKLMRAYIDFHKAGYAHSLEVWNGGDLIGGVYGVYVAGLFCGESLFHLRPNAGKLALVRLVEFLRAQGLPMMDIQMVTPLTESFGGKYISRQVFLQRLEQSKLEARAIDFKI